MAAQRERAKAAQKGAGEGVDLDAYRDVVEQFGVTEFVGLHQRHRPRAGCSP